MDFWEGINSLKNFFYHFSEIQVQKKQVPSEIFGGLDQSETAE